MINEIHLPISETMPKSEGKANSLTELTNLIVKTYRRTVLEQPPFERSRLPGND